jgi:hypothetical protein
MFFHLPSFLLGYAAGLGTGLVLPRLRPLAVEVASAALKFVDDVATRTAAVREDLEDLVAEARARVRGARAPREPSVPTPQASA